MATKNIEFVVNYVVEGATGTIRPIGRCGDHPIEVGDVFTLVYRNRPRETAEELATAAERIWEHPVALHVVEIQAYGRVLQELGEGMTGSLVLSGEGGRFVQPGFVLSVQHSS
ncbi:MAG TPA: hypothetical protein VEL76_14335 [Gemmataceae bacterium]|nr:hypothetical protein [Gemmataceae bacterium]